jgi:hypothetical protein
MRLILLLIQLLMGISTNLYLPAIGTAGLLLLEVSGDNRVPAPPPKMMAMVDLDISKLFGLWAFLVDINELMILILEGLM